MYLSSFGMMCRGLLLWLVEWGRVRGKFGAGHVKYRSLLGLVTSHHVLAAELCLCSSTIVSYIKAICLVRGVCLWR